MKNNDNLQSRRVRREKLLDSIEGGSVSIKDIVRELRAISNLNQDQFAQHCEVSPRAIKMIESGQGNPTISTLNKIGAVLGLEVAFVKSAHHKTAPSVEHIIPKSLVNGDSGIPSWHPLNRLLVKIDEVLPPIDELAKEASRKTSEFDNSHINARSEAEKVGNMVSNITEWRDYIEHSHKPRHNLEILRQHLEPTPEVRKWLIEMDKINRVLSQALETGLSKISHS